MGVQTLKPQEKCIKSSSALDVYLQGLMVSSFLDKIHVFLCIFIMKSTKKIQILPRIFPKIAIIVKEHQEIQQRRDWFLLNRKIRVYSVFFLYHVLFFLKPS